MAPQPSVLEIVLKNGAVLVLTRNEYGAYEYCYGSIALTVRKEKSTWVSVTKFRTVWTDDSFTVYGCGTTPEGAVQDGVDQAKPRLASRYAHVRDMTDMLEVR